MQIPRKPVNMSETSPTLSSSSTATSAVRTQDQADATTTDGNSTPRTSTDSGRCSRAQVPLSSAPSGELSLDSREFNVKYWFADNGRVSMKVKRHAAWLDDGILSQATTETSTSQQPSPVIDPPPYAEVADGRQLKNGTGLALNVVMHVLGSLDEVLHFVAVARTLHTRYGHRVRIATHPEFKTEVEGSGAEFFGIGEASSEPPSKTHQRSAPAGTLERQGPAQKETIWTIRSVTQSVMDRFWKACVEPGHNGKAFVADAIIANPQSCSHMHCAEKLGVPLHFMSTIPWTPTRDFAHPLVDVVSSEIGPQLTNRLSYSIVEATIWRHIGLSVNQFRQDTLGLPQMQLAFAPGLLNRLNCPVTCFRSSHCLTRPRDWPSHVHFYNGKPEAMIQNSVNPVAIEDAEIAFAAQHFVDSLEERKLRCTLLSDRAAAWRVTSMDIRLSTVAAAVLRKQGLLEAKDVNLYRAREYDLEDRPHDPMTSLAASTYDTISSVLLGVAAGPLEAYKKSQLEIGTKEVPGRPPITSNPEEEELEEQNFFDLLVVSTANGVGDIMAAGLMMPVTFTHGLAKGFHNVPRLYGDQTVRDAEKITGVTSGLAAAGKGLAHGLYDGLSGFVTQPYQGAKADGARGFLKGFGKGLGGVIFKPAAGACGVPGYAFMGIYRELQKTGQASKADHVTAARLAQGEDEYKLLSNKDVRSVVEAWQSLRASRHEKGRS